MTCSTVAYCDMKLLWHWDTLGALGCCMALWDTVTLQKYVTLWGIFGDLLMWRWGRLGDTRSSAGMFWTEECGQVLGKVDMVWRAEHPESVRDRIGFEHAAEEDNPLEEQPTGWDDRPKQWE
ncbi:hypothetical protein EDC04DRAFT_3094890 [Pisolithus marmoratus]|nr:hypothetical protein EDC04DRAFT_3094890 [Pisolithus marmoratus]